MDGLMDANVCMTFGRLSDHVPLSAPVELGHNGILKIILTATEDGTAKRPHQAFLLVRDQDTGLEATFPFAAKESGKARVDFVRIPDYYALQLSGISVGNQILTNIYVKTHKDLPTQFLLSTSPLRVTLLLASFGPSQAFSNHVFNLIIKTDPNVPLPVYEKPLRYGKREEINHIFKADAKSGPVFISVLFVAAILATVPVLLGAVRSPVPFS